MKNWNCFGATLATTSLLLMLAACSKGDKPVNETIDGALSSTDETMDDDGSYYHPHIVKIAEGHDVTVSLKSDAFDTYLLVVPPDGSEQRENDDCDEEDATKGSCLSFTAHVGGDWQFVANSFDGGQTGAYTITIAAQKP